MTIQVTVSLSNRHRLCIGEITRTELEGVDSEAPFVDGAGVYLVKVDAENPLEPGEVLAKFTSEHAAKELAQLFRLSGRMERAA